MTRLTRSRKYLRARLYNYSCHLGFFYEKILYSRDESPSQTETEAEHRRLRHKEKQTYNVFKHIARMVVVITMGGGRQVFEEAKDKWNL